MCDWKTEKLLSCLSPIVASFNTYKTRLLLPTLMVALLHCASVEQHTTQCCNLGGVSDRRTCNEAQGVAK